MTDVIRHGRQEPLLPGRNEARLVTREQLAAALHAAYYEHREADEPLSEWEADLDNAVEWYKSPNEMADVIFAALPAAAPAEGLDMEALEKAGRDFVAAYRRIGEGLAAFERGLTQGAALPAAAPAEGLREALRELFAAGGRVNVGGSLAALDRFEKAQIEAGAALARQGEAELSEFRHHESAGSE